MIRECNARPVKLQPAFKDYIWGGDKLKTLFHKKTELSPLAESWELSCHPNGMSIIASGDWKGRTFEEYLKYYGKQILGKKCGEYDKFPLLIKLIDARENLSIQVHPDDGYALKNENQYGKTEMWYVAECEPDAYLYCGFSKEITKEEFQRKIEDNTLLDVLNKVPVHKGDIFFIPPGTIHAICAGVVIAEIQQNSDVTYRVYDYNRRDAQGNLRPLHKDKALECTRLTSPPLDFNRKGEPIATEGAVITPLKKCPYFNVSLLEVATSYTIQQDTDSFSSLLCLDGECKLTGDVLSMDMQKGDSIFIPANTAPLTIIGNTRIILSKV